MLIKNQKIKKQPVLANVLNNQHTWLEISKFAIEHNLAQYKKVIGNKILAPVIKANAYGHGLLEIARICQENLHVDWLCLTLLSDAIFLRSNSITKPILVFGPIDTNPAQAVNKNIEFVAYNCEMIEQLNTIGKAHNYIFGVHIKVDTGLSRIGRAPKNIIGFIKYCNTLPNIKITGVCTHLAESQKEDDCFIIQQKTVFDAIVHKLKDEQIHIPYKHISNTAATTRFSSDIYNFFRIGIGMYGLWPSKYIKSITLKQYPNFTLKPCLTWKARIMETKKVPTSSYIGYNRTYCANKDTIIAIVPVGYFDGYDLRFSNKACVRIKDSYAKIIGRVCMNHTVIDVTDISNVKIGNEVLLLGNYPKVSAYYFASLTGNDNVREILTKIFPHIPRIIVT